MTKAKYLRIVGYIELISSIIGIIVGFIYMVGITIGAAWALNALGIPKAITGFTLFLSWLTFAAACFFAPALGILFIAVADLMDNGCPTSIDVSSAVDAKLEGMNSRLRKVEQNKETQKKEPKKEETSTAANVESDNKDEESPAEESNRVAVNSPEEQKKTYNIDTVVKFKEDMLVDGVQIKQGETGVIVDILRGFAGRQYAVILDSSKEKVLVREDCFEQ